jgi:putative FmdB family regulatory protein
MPVYEYECQGCKKAFTLVLTLREHDEEELVCPDCGSKEVRQLISTFIAKTDSKT